LTTRAGPGFQREIDRALIGAYQAYAREHPSWAQAHFDEHFLRSLVAPLLAAYASDLSAVTPEVVVQLWAGERLWFNAQTRREAMLALRPTVERFLNLLASELDGL
jgi:hypothetical protein